MYLFLISYLYNFFQIRFLFLIVFFFSPFFFLDLLRIPHPDNVFICYDYHPGGNRCQPPFQSGHPLVEFNPSRYIWCFQFWVFRIVTIVIIVYKWRLDLI